LIVPGQAVNGLLDLLAQRGVGVHVAGDLVNPEVPLLGQGQFGQQYGDFGSDEVGAEQLAVGVVAQDLHEAGWITQTLCFAVGRERECSDLDVVTEFPCLGSV
jgi:hypothetical protein